MYDSSSKMTKSANVVNIGFCNLIIATDVISGLYPDGVISSQT